VAQVSSKLCLILLLLSAGPPEMRPRSRNDFAIAIICALPLEAEAVEALFDEYYDRLGKHYGKAPGDANAYINGRLGKHDVVLCYMPGMGKRSAASVATGLKISYRGVKLALVVGICGGAPSPPEYREIFLGDVVISDSVIEYDFGRQYPGGYRRKTGVQDTLGRPGQEIRTLLNGLRAENSRIELHNRTQQYLQALQQKAARWSHPGVSDVLFRASYLHKHYSHPSPAECSCFESDSPEIICEEALGKDCDELGCDSGQQIRCREVSGANQPSIYIGPVASADTVMKSGQHRDEITRREKVLGFEMEGAGVWDNVPCVIIKGVCDYADSHKNKLWQAYAAATGASVAKALLEYWVPESREGKSNFQGFLRSISNLCPADKFSASHLVFRNIPFSKNEGFFGRAGQLSQLEELLFSPGRQHKVAITGLGGVGKTQIALEFAYRTQQSRPECSIYWIPATNFETLQRTYFHIAQQLKLPGLEEEGADAKKLVKDHLGDSSAGQWLLIFDNADDIDMWFGKPEGTTEPCQLSDYVPWSRTGSVLFTTRFTKVASKLAMQNVIRVPELDEAGALELLSERLVDKSLLQNRDQAALLLKQLTYLPLAIVQAASYINENCLSSLADYLSLLSAKEEEVIDLLSEEFEDDWRPHHNTNPVAATWLISFERVQRTNRLATDILSFMACIEPTEIPESLLPIPLAGSRKAWVESIGVLEGYAFVTRRPAKSFDLHRLVHLATRNWLRRIGSLSKWTLTTLTRLEEIFPNDDHTNRDKWKAYLPHALGLLGKEEVQGIRQRYDLLYKVSMCLLADGRATEAVQYLEERCNWQKREYDEKHPKRLASQHALAGAYQANGQIKQAMELLEQVVAVRERTLDEEHPDRLASQHELARAYQANGQIKQAVELLDHVVAVGERTLDEEHPDRLASQHALAGAYRANGQVKQAVQLLEQVVAVRERTLADEHRDRLASQHELARAYQANGQIKQAMELLEQVVAVRGRTLAEEHPDRLASQHALAGAYRANGQVKQAVQLLEHVVAVEERTLDEEHPDRLASQHALAGAYRANGQIKQAVELLDHVVTVQERTLAKENPSRLASQHALAMVYQADGKIKQAMELLEQVVAVRERTLAEEHPDRLASQHELAMAYQANGQIKQAVELLEHVVAVGERTLAEEHPDQLASQHVLASAYQANGQIKQAVELLEHVVAVEESTLAEEHPSRLASQHALAELVLQMSPELATPQ
jgi:nucleoside phosphorylase/tetratricopeptide (TPR) repeat protein